MSESCTLQEQPQLLHETTPLHLFSPTDPSSQSKIDESWVCSNLECKKTMKGRLPYGKSPQCCDMEMFPPANLEEWFFQHCVRDVYGCPYWERVPPGKQEYSCQHPKPKPDDPKAVCGKWMVPNMPDNFADM